MLVGKAGAGAYLPAAIAVSLGLYSRNVPQHQCAKQSRDVVERWLGLALQSTARHADSAVNAARSLHVEPASVRLVRVRAGWVQLEGYWRCALLVFEYGTGREGVESWVPRGMRADRAGASPSTTMVVDSPSTTMEQTWNTEYRIQSTL